ncbi:MAG TPA: ATP synthase F1 subunit epsilon [Acidimicrobiales bacterium]|jgi:F-type H+-transporting ATPase subunit epsilon
MHVELVSPERIIYSGEADQVIARTMDGEIAFLTGHAPFIGALDIAQVVVTDTDGNRVQAAVHGGFVEVSHNRVIILSDVAELAGDIDRPRAEAAARRAEEATRAGEDEEAEAALRRAQVRLALVS